jgi:hypothetical protein
MNCECEINRIAKIFRVFCEFSTKKKTRKYEEHLQANPSWTSRWRSQGKSSITQCTLTIIRSLAPLIPNFSLTCSEKVSNRAATTSHIADILKWSVDEVGTWLDLISLSELKPLFSQEGISGPELADLTGDDLIGLGVKK